jgi:hypothetical protein
MRGATFMCLTKALPPNGPTWSRQPVPPRTPPDHEHTAGAITRKPALPLVVSWIRNPWLWATEVGT